MRHATAAAAAATTSYLPASCMLPLQSRHPLTAPARHRTDDLGWGDTQTRNPFSPTPHIGQLAYEGIDLLQHYVYMCEWPTTLPRVATTHYMYPLPRVPCAPSVPLTSRLTRACCCSTVCSPTRRSILSGRFPIHIWGHQAPVCSNYLPLQFTLLPAKMKLAGFETHSIGKGHLGYQTTDHLPINRGFDSHFGFLEGEISYYHGLSEDQLAGNKTGPPPENKNPTNQTGPCFMNQPGETPAMEHNCSYDLWEGQVPASRATVTSMDYSTNEFAARAIEKINARAAGAPLYIHLTWQNVHAPYAPPPDWENLKSQDYLSNYCSKAAGSARPTTVTNRPFPEDLRCNFGGTLKTVDDGMRNVTVALKQKGESFHKQTPQSF